MPILALVEDRISASRDEISATSRYYSVVSSESPAESDSPNMNDGQAQGAASTSPSGMAVSPDEAAARAIIRTCQLTRALKNVEYLGSILKCNRKRDLSLLRISFLILPRCAGLIRLPGAHC